jgi:sortase A
MKRRLLISEICLFAIAAALIGTAAFRLLRFEAFQKHPEWFLAERVRPANERARTLKTSSVVQGGSWPRYLGLLQTPRIGFHVQVIEGDDENSLAIAAGHVPGTAALGEVGNAVIAGHRDTAFRPLRNLRVGDLIYFREATQRFSYRVESFRIVKPDATEVLANRNSPILTLITCYPFVYSGSAPMRFVVTARRIGS